MLTVEDVAARFESVRPGYRLVGAEEVLVPVAWTYLDAIVQEALPLGPIEEYILRSVEAGFGRPDEVAALLGLRLALVEHTLALQMQGDLIDYVVGGDGGRRLLLQEAGRIALAEAERGAPQRAEVRLAFDLVIRSIRVVHPADLLRPREAKELDEPVIKVSTRQPRLDEVTTDDVQRALTSQMGRRRQKLQVLAVRDVARVESRFQNAVVLTYMAESETAQLEQVLIVDGRESPEHDRVFRERPELLDAIVVPAAAREVVESPPLPTQVDDTVAKTSMTEAHDLKREIAVLRRQVDQQVVSITADGLDPTSEPEVSGVIGRLEEAKRQLEELPVRRVSVFEHPLYLSEALEKTRERLLIISPWIRAHVVDHQFLRRLERLAKKGVRIHIRYGIDDSKPEFAQDRKALKALERVADRHTEMALIRGRPTHAKVLLWDSKLITTSFNWLSFKGDPKRGYRQEEGTLISHAEWVQEQYRVHLAEIEEEAAQR